MTSRPIAFVLLLAATTAAAALIGPARADAPWRFIMPEQRSIRIRNPNQLPHVALPETPAPPTVSEPRFNAPPRDLSLDDAIRVALENAEVVRVLAGVTAVSSGQTIYDAAITNTFIDQERARFDPSVIIRNNWDRIETPFAFEDPGDPLRTLIDGTRTDAYNVDFQLSKTNITGGTAALDIVDTHSRFRPGVFLLNPRETSTLGLSYTQPLLQGGGRRANLAPIVIAQIDTERSFFQMKGSVQSLVRGAIEGYWNLVFARTDLWTREQQVKQADFAYRQAEARARTGNISPAEVAQTRVSLANFRATLITARANVLQREAALRNLLGLPPYGEDRITPTSPPTDERLELDWGLLVSLAEQYRPDLIELKLVLEADQQFLMQAQNQALPRVDAVGVYRWNGLEGVMPIGDPVSSPFSQNTDWTLGVNFSVPLGLRQSRAQLRQRELIIARDRANLTQGLHSAVHDVALSVRNLDQFFEQYLAYQETKSAARDNLELQMGRYQSGLNPYINVLQAIVDWGNSVSNEAQAVTQYNTELAQLQLETGTILETHGVYFFQERYGSIGPKGRLCAYECYPRDMRPTDNENVYPVGDEPAEDFFDLDDPLSRLRKRQRADAEELPPLQLPEPILPETDYIGQ
ncbi:TolC family protein [Bythopirellula polymerisocia]|uniref:Outer membrane efflux protein n=1 Tax=Bythopirellula polymerisocia TaxID=2528003 RepID=A0A5C6CTI7_9BACT|nr:TolC family protein [Bythopirellula polymerisocia]TWU27842.1 Outer membrane efflux protein [Bythopirellula polymerisocia]